MRIGKSFCCSPSPLIGSCKFLKRGQAGGFGKCVLSNGWTGELNLVNLVSQLLGSLMAKGYGLNHGLELFGAFFLKLGAMLLVS